MKEVQARYGIQGKTTVLMWLHKTRSAGLERRRTYWLAEDSFMPWV
jgi:hypothetical protein